MLKTRTPNGETQATTLVNPVEGSTPSTSFFSSGGSISVTVSPPQETERILLENNLLTISSENLNVINAFGARMNGGVSDDSQVRFIIHPSLNNDLTQNSSRLQGRYHISHGELENNGIRVIDNFDATLATGGGPENNIAVLVPTPFNGNQPTLSIGRTQDASNDEAFRAAIIDALNWAQSRAEGAFQRSQLQLEDPNPDLETPRQVARIVRNTFSEVNSANGGSFVEYTRGLPIETIRAYRNSLEPFLDVSTIMELDENRITTSLRIGGGRWQGLNSLLELFSTRVLEHMVEHLPMPTLTVAISELNFSVLAAYLTWLGPLILRLYPMRVLLRMSGNMFYTHFRDSLYATLRERGFSISRINISRMRDEVIAGITEFGVTANNRIYSTVGRYLVVVQHSYNRFMANEFAPTALMLGGISVGTLTLYGNRRFLSSFTQDILIRVGLRSRTTSQVVISAVIAAGSQVIDVLNEVWEEINRR